MKHVFKATKLGWEKEKEGIWFDSEIIQRRKQKMNLNHMKEPHKEGIHILDTSMMARNIMM